MVIESMSRLERSIKGLVERMELFQGKRVHLVNPERSIDVRCQHKLLAHPHVGHRSVRKGRGHWWLVLMPCQREAQHQTQDRSHVKHALL